MLRDNEAVDILFDELAERFADRTGGYTRVVRLAKVRLGDAGQQALVEFVGDRDRVRSQRRTAPIVSDEDDVTVPPEDEVVAQDDSAEQAAEESTDDEDTEKE